MKTLPGGLQAHLDSGSTTLAWCWRIERADGEVFGFTDHDRDLVFGGDTYEAESGLSASEIRASLDLSVDAQDADGALTSDRITETDIIDGRWDNAWIEVWRVNWEDVSERVLMRRGNLGQITRGPNAFSAEVRSLAHWLNQTVGRTFQYYCDADLGDSRCGIALGSPTYTGSGAVTALSGDRGFSASGLGAYASDWFALGVVTWTSGANAGRMAEVMSHGLSGGVASIVLQDSPILPVALGDTFSISAGCDKVSETCRTKFGNFINFRGFPTIPGDETIQRYASQSDPNTGAVIGDRT